MDDSTQTQAGFFQLRNELVDDEAIGGNAIAVYAVLMRHRNQKTGECYPSHERIAQLTKYSVSTVRRALRQLGKVGLIEVVPRTDERGGQTSNGYRLKLVVAKTEGNSPPGRSGGSKTKPDTRQTAMQPEPKQFVASGKDRYAALNWDE